MSSWDEDAETGPFGELLREVAETPSAQPELEAGARIAEHYEVVRQIGSGGMGVVFLATDVRLGRRVALKLHNVDAREETRQRSIREATAMARLQHPNVVAVYDVGHVHEDQLFIAMEYVDGVTLREWLAAEPRTGPQIISQFVQAGRGIFAAHNAGMVHRDIKPDNILVGRDGRVRVADFGLAGRRGDLPKTATDPFGRIPNPADLTKAGSFVGTPAYASPEQWQNAPLDARSDQYSFCAALFEALYGHHAPKPPPPSGYASKFEALPAPPEPGPAAPRTPAAVRRILLRGLSVEPSDRHPDMGALVAALESQLGAARRLLWFGGAVAAAGTIAVGMFVLARPAPCGGPTPLETYWTADRRTAISAALGRAADSEHADAASRVVAELDGYERDWSAGNREACRERSVVTDESEHGRDRRMICLEHRARAFRALADALASSNEERAARALRSAIDLPSVALCSDRRYLVALAPPPASTQVAARVATLQDQLARVRALLDGGDFEAALSAGRDAAKDADSVDYLPIRAEAEWWVGRAQRWLGQYESARDSMEGAYFLAQKAGHEVVAIEIATDLVYLSSFDLSENKRAIEWGRHASAALERLGGAGPLLGRLLMNLGTALEQDGRHEEAIEVTQRAVQDLERVLGPDHADVATALTRYGSALEAKGDSKEAGVVLERAVELTEEIFGASHRELHRPLAELGQVLSPLGDNARAIAVQQRALDICRASFGPEHVNTGFAELNLGVAYHWANDLKTAGRHYRQAAQIVEKTLGPDHRDTALCLTNLALTMPDDPVEAANLHRRVIQIFSKQGAEHTDVGRARINLARVLVGMKDFEGARREAELAVAIWDRATPDGPNVSFALQLVGLALIEAKRPQEAVAPLTRAVQIREAAEFSPRYLADSRFELARALYTPKGDRARAVSLARAALEAYEGLGEEGTAERDKVRAWLQRR